MLERLGDVEKLLSGTRFSWRETEGAVEVTCPWGNRIRIHEPGSEDVRFIEEEEIGRHSSGTFLGDYRADQHRVHLIPPGVDQDLFRPLRGEVQVALADVLGLEREDEREAPPA